MSILDNVKALVEPLVFKKDGSVSCGFGVRIQMSVILDRENWIKIEDGIKTIEAELTRLRAVNAELVEALEKIRIGQHDPAIGEEEPELLEDQVWRYQQWVRRDQDCAIDALSRAEHAKPEPETCVWTMDEGEWHTACDNDESFEDCDPINTGFYTYCPFCGKRIEVKK